MEHKRLRGTRDITGEDSAAWEQIIKSARSILSVYGYSLIITPVMEELSLFCRGIGEATDIVLKEMYDFEDKGGRRIVLRPEATAAVVRAYIENTLPEKSDLFYMGPMFRYERPQKGRYREFFQIGAESFGDNTPHKDAEIIMLGRDILKSCGVKEFSLKLNSLAASAGYREKLVSFLNSVKGSLCESCLKKLERAPIRVLDCKNPECKKAAAAAPLITDNLTPEGAAHFDGVKKLLKSASVEFMEDPSIVRGLDYYTGAVFEFTTELLGPQQNTLLAGGRYDSLVNSLGGKDVPATGFALGIDRLAEVLKVQGSVSAPQKTGAFIVYDAKYRDRAFELLQALRAEGIKASASFEPKSFKAQFREADSGNFKFALVLGDNEIENNTVSIKDMETGGQQESPFDSAAKKLK
ncbi:MAG TPA: histidine--tRNA ligase [bacterium]|nr:histidine--tRNA ligase [bacterium]